MKPWECKIRFDLSIEDYQDLSNAGLIRPLWIGIHGGILAGEFAIKEEDLIFYSEGKYDTWAIWNGIDLTEFIPEEVFERNKHRFITKVEDEG